MSTPFDDSPEDLVALRATVEDWLVKAMKAVWSFHHRDGSFWRDTNQPDENKKDPSSLTASARAHMALAYANRYKSKEFKKHVSDWVQGFQNFAAEQRLEYTEGKGLRDLRNSKNKKPGTVNNFELSHLSDCIFVSEFCGRFSFITDSSQQKVNLLKGVNEDEFRAKISELILGIFEDASTNQSTAAEPTEQSTQEESESQAAEDNSDSQSPEDKGNMEEGQVYFELGERDSRHFFVTLHALRSLAILEIEHRKLGFLGQLTRHAQQLCVEQCYYSQRGQRHLQDVARLVFAGVVYCMYAPRVDRDLCLAIVEALSEAQLQSGNWPATHPIMRNKGKDPWYISTHEIALCLTWLYFQPRLPDSARPLLLKMMEMYFVNWVVPTYTRIARDVESGDKSERQEFKGWYDDRATGHDVVVGWATSIVCHFLANYYSVLNDHINRRVIESLNLEEDASDYLIDRTKNKASPKWKESENRGMDNGGGERAIWPDIPPFAWSATARTGDQIACEIAWKWTDPELDSGLSRRLAYHVLIPVLQSRDARPGMYSAGILDGPPGTRKTSFVQTLAQILEWPQISVPASVMFSEGFDQIETQASKVFRRLNYLTQCVIFFDEFEEFFRDRKSQDKPRIHDRTIAAFTTSAMLPRLQELHDKQRTLVFLATNHLNLVDDAIIRPGRFDFKETIGHPVVERFVSNGQYLCHPTKRLLDDLDIDINSEKFSAEDGPQGQSKLTDVAGAVKKAIVDLTVEAKLRKFRTTRRQLDEIIDYTQIPFTFVEEALRRVEKKWKGGERDQDILVKVGVDALLDVCERATGEKGPPGLPEVELDSN